MSDSFTSTKFAWFRQLAIDSDLTAAAKSVGIVIGCDFMSREEGCAWPAISTIARRLDLAESTTRKAVRQLEAQGHLRVEQGRGRSSTSRYFWIIKGGDEEAAAEKNTESPALNQQKTTGTSALYEQKTTDIGAGKPPRSERKNHRDRSNKTTEVSAPTPLNDSFDDSIEGEISPLPPKTTEEEFDLEPPQDRRKPKISADATNGRDSWRNDFDEFYRNYPRRVARGDAEKAYVKALKIGSPAEILKGCLRFSAAETAAYAAGKELRYTPHAATWLNGKRWLDSAEAPPAAAKPTTRQAASHFARQLRNAATAMRDRDEPDLGPVAQLSVVRGIRS